MQLKNIQIIVIILIFLSFIILIYMGYRGINYHNNISSNTEIKDNTETGYANINDAYIRPFIMQDLLTQDQCKNIIEYCQEKLVDSEIMTGKETNIRNSKQCWIPRDNDLVKFLFENISKTFKIPIENAEYLQVVRYLPNQYFNEHHDGCCDDNDKCKNFISSSGQRVLTVLIYLNNDFGEGYTYFRNMDLKIKAPTGGAIVFYPLAKNSNKCHPLALHAGMPVTSGEKWIANLWFHEKKFII